MRASAPPEDPGSTPSRRVLIARGTEAGDLRTLAELLESAGIEYGIEDESVPGGTGQSWQVFVRPRDVLRARVALQQLIRAGSGGAGSGGDTPPPGPLFEGGGRSLTQSLLVVACFGLGFALLLRACTG